MNRAENKATRLLQIENLLLAHPEGLTQAEIARKLQVDRSTINRDLMDLPASIYIDDIDGGKLKIDRSASLINLNLTLHEAMALHLASRLLATRMDRKNPHTASALRKLSLSMRRWADQIGHHVSIAADMMDDDSQKDDPNYVRVMELLTEGWANHRKVKIWHRSEKMGKTFMYLVSPYFIEPYAIGQTTQLICLSEPPGTLRTYKVERIERAEKTNEPYTIPKDFDPRSLLAEAWGIWYTDEEPQRILLRFTPRVAYRVKESLWHPTQIITEQDNGSLLWEAEIAEPQEMLPWIRGWGADCEVLEPKYLRETLEREVRKLAKLYGIGNISGPKSSFFAHRREGEDREDWQPLIEHLKKTAEMARDFCADANIAELAYIAGLIHDLGKYSDAFQKRLEGTGPRVEHSTAGAKELKALLKGTPQEVFAHLLVYPIMGHHTGLPDYGNETDLEGGTVCARLKNQLPDYSAYKSEVDLYTLSFPKRLNIQPLRLRVFPDKPTKDYFGFSLSFLVRMIYSALVDADFQETETYMKGSKPRGGYDDITTLRDKMGAYLKQFENPSSDINHKRNEILQACIAKGMNEKPGFFSLTVPTGGGKTLASMAFALHHAAEHGLKRVIYVIPFTTIIEQNAKVFKTIFGEGQVLEHHSNFDWEGKKRDNPDDRTNSALAKLKLAAENWDIPIVVTTNVQFFESLFANRSSRCRKLHNIAKSVIIFDEAQMLPREYMRPAMAAVWELVTNYGASAVFCTATQPGLERFLPENAEVRELAPNPHELFNFYKRVEVKYVGTLPDEDLITRLNAHEQALCIVNTRRHASGLFSGLEGEGNFHLSTLMCPAHRRTKLEEIKERLSSGKPCRVVSTTVMEAGIDLDFPVGYRALSGLDSINQAAGRVNREMRRGVSEMFVFEPKSEFIKKTPSFLKQSAEVTRMVLRDHAAEPISIPVISAFFERLYDLQDPNISFDVKRIMECFDSADARFKYETAAREFQIIEDSTETVIIPYNEEAQSLIEELKSTDYPFFTLRKLQPYTVSIFTTEFDKLSSKGVILTIDDTYYVLNPDYMKEYYDFDKGLIIPENGGGDGLLF
ncbi:CRISPR-associated helicase/endonuclease Cas3 [Gracilinema caldarium]|uniref:Metal dependent phosphohydrolase n=1 Tax=Gracilinema caldarium (strain ATCC 51460 / DSM 7334 / H1) TaxID=744872 RepID=F8F440_GRAC1|nr:CRISPR-associated helicase/endonuclease Cas3 [Gracilinema caldarium]AEJ20059.1 metal dependent phosphohydrolase [Gracilinema caldarium DSM 7334]